MVDSIIVLLIDQYALVQMVLIAFLGSLIGELLQEVNNDTPIVFIRFVANFLASGFVATIATLLMREFITKNTTVLSAISGFMGYMGHKASSAFAIQLITKFVGSFFDNNSNKEGK